MICHCNGPAAGKLWMECLRHSCRKTVEWTRLCQRDQQRSEEAGKPIGYWKAWEDVIGPGQRVRRPIPKGLIQRQNSGPSPCGQRRAEAEADKNEQAEYLRDNREEIDRLCRECQAVLPTPCRLTVCRRRGKCPIGRW